MPMNDLNSSSGEPGRDHPALPRQPGEFGQRQHGEHRPPLGQRRDRVAGCVGQAPLVPQPGQPGPLVNLAGVLADQASGFMAKADAAEAAGDQAKAAQFRAEATRLKASAAIGPGPVENAGARGVQKRQP